MEIDGWLRAGGWVVAASERAARAVAMEFNRARLAEGLTAWPAPKISNWNSFVHAAWVERSNGGGDGRLLLNAAQEQALWTEILRRSQQLATVLEGPRHRLAGLAMEAHELLCSFAPKYIQNAKARSAWQQDAGAFSGWLQEFDEECRTQNLLSANRLGLELVPLLEADAAKRPDLLLVGFDRILPAQRQVFDAWGPWRQAAPAAHTQRLRFHAAENEQAELAACAEWCARALAANPEARLLVISQDAGKRRGQMERALLRATGDASAFEFSLGVALSQVGLARAAALLLRWLTGPLAEHEVDWLLGSGQTAASGEEAVALQAYMRALRRRDLERTDWSLDAFLSQRMAAQKLPASWAERMRQARARVAAEQRRKQSPVEWAAFVPAALLAAGWPGGRALESAEFQTLRRWEQAVDQTASLGFDGQAVKWDEFLAALSRTLEETLFSPESRNAPIQIAGPAESAGLTADGLWFLGAREDAWPAKGATHPLLPLDVQKDAAMPHATPQLDWELARAMTERLMASAAEVHFSYARQDETAEARPSRLVEQAAGTAEPLPPSDATSKPVTEAFEDLSRVPFPAGQAGGGASVLTSQSQCAFKAFATSRLAAQGWQAAQQGLTAKQRGQLLHEVLHSVWAGGPDGIRTHDELLKIQDKAAFVAAHVRRVLQSEMPEGARERMPQRYLALEEPRLTRLVTEWLEYEARRWAFEVMATEVDRSVAIEGLQLKLRLDRVDRLKDGTLLVIDYKTGDVSPKAWELPRPDDVQLPLYAGFALNKEEELLGGLVFAKVRAGKAELAGRVGDAAATLLPGLKATSGLVRSPMSGEELDGWKEHIEKLAREFIAGNAEVNPREYPRTCERCGLQSLCRVQERDLVEGEDDDDAEDGDE